METTKKQNWFLANWKKSPLFSTGIVLVLMILLQTLALGFSFNSFGEWLGTWTNNWLNLIRNNVYVGVIALGMTFVIISGGIDLAVGSTFVAVGAFTMVLIDTNGILSSIGLGGPLLYLLAIVLAMALGSLLGLFNGVLVTAGKLPPFIATLGTLKIFRSVTQYFMQGPSPKVPKGFLQIASFEIGGQMLLPILYFAAIAVILHLVSKKTTFGRYVYAIGSNEKATALSGININKVKRRVYLLVGLMSSIAAILAVSRIGSMDYASAGSGYELDAIAAVIVGGTSMSGGKGSVFGTVLGFLIIIVMNNLLNLIGVPPFLREAFKGAIVIGAVLLQRKEKAA